MLAAVSDNGLEAGVSCVFRVLDPALWTEPSRQMGARHPGWSGLPEKGRSSGSQSCSDRTGFFRMASRGPAGNELPGEDDVDLAARKGTSGHQRASGLLAGPFVWLWSTAGTSLGRTEQRLISFLVTRRPEDAGCSSSLVTGWRSGSHRRRPAEQPVPARPLKCHPRLRCDGSRLRTVRPPNTCLPVLPNPPYPSPPRLDERR